jgi:signal transduction histidine kinase
MADGWTSFRANGMVVAEEGQPGTGAGHRSVLYRTILLLGLSWLLITGVVLASLVYLSGMTARQMMPLKDHIVFYNRLYALRLDLGDYDVSAQPQHKEWQRIQHQLSEYARAEGALDSNTRYQLARAAETFAAAEPGVSGQAGHAQAEAMAAATRVALSRILYRELSAQNSLLDELGDFERRQWQASLALAFVLILATGMVLIFFHWKVRAPLNDLTYLMGLLSEKDYASALSGRTDPLMRPVFDKYNEMVERLRAFEEEHLAREEKLRSELARTTRELVRQQRSLGRAERLAAAGDLAARVAHELRNPLAAVLMSLGNLREDVITDDKRQRVDQMIRELQRAAAVLSGVLASANVEREAPVRLRLAPVVAEVVNLLRLQLDEHVSLDFRVDDSLTCTLPESRFRHALFDLLTNVAQTVSATGGHIDMSFVRENGDLLIRIVDDGPGFPDSVLESANADWEAPKAGGTGLSLALVRRFVHDHGGRLLLSNLEPRGALSEVCLPLETSSG